MKTYSFILSEKTFRLENEADLALLFQMFSQKSTVNSVIHWNILMEVDTDLEHMITSYTGLLRVMKYLNEKNAFLLLVKLWDVLLSIIDDSKKLAEILSKIPEESNKYKLLSILRVRGLKSLLFDARDLRNIFEWLYGDTQRKFIDLLGKDFIKELFASTNEIIMTLHHLEHTNKDYLMEILWISGIKHKVKTSQNLLIMINGLTSKKAKEFLSLFSPEEILDLFKTESDWYQFMIRLSPFKEKLFLSYLQK